MIIIHKVASLYLTFWEHNGNVAFIYHAILFLVLLMWLWHRLLVRFMNQDRQRRNTWLADTLKRDRDDDEKRFQCEKR